MVSSFAATSGLSGFTSPFTGRPSESGFSYLALMIWSR